MTEVFVVDRAALFGGEWPQGFVALDQTAGSDLLRQAHDLGRFVDRPTAERTPAWKQWIPYCVVRCRPAGTESESGVFCVRRTRGQSEARLHGLWSIGLGGHIEPVDVAGATGAESFFGAALRRELEEELSIDTRLTIQPKFLGLLNDDGTEVGQVHAGLVYAWDVELPAATAGGQVGIAEVGKMEGGFGSLVEFRKLWQNPDQFETWSRFLVGAGVVPGVGAR
jgi:predicted NUDIX family phosphoesterase